MLVAKATKHLRGGVPLLGRCGLVVGENLVDGALKGTEDRSLSVREPGDGVRLGVPQDLADRVSRKIELPGRSPDGHAIAMRPPNSAVIVHRKHFLCLRASECFHDGTLTLTKAATGGSIFALRLPPKGSFLGAQCHFPTVANRRAARDIEVANRRGLGGANPRPLAPDCLTGLGAVYSVYHVRGPPSFEPVDRSGILDVPCANEHSREHSSQESPDSEVPQHQTKASHRRNLRVPISGRKLLARAW